MSETAYKYRITVACPESLCESANHLAVAVGEMAGDYHSFNNLTHVDQQGNRYSVISTVVTDLFFVYAGSQLVKRDFAPDNWSFRSATEAQMAVNIWAGPTEQKPEMPTAQPGVILGIVGDDCLGVIAAMGLERIAEEERV